MKLSPTAVIARLQTATKVVSTSAVCLLAFAFSPAQAQMYQSDVAFAAENESMWGPGGAGVLEVNYFVGPTWGDSCTGSAAFSFAGSACASDVAPNGTVTTGFNGDDPLGDSIGGTESITTPGFTLIPEVCVWGLGCTPAVNVPPVNLGTYGAEATAETAGQLGFNLDIDATTGDVDVDYGGEVSFEWPAPEDIVGDTITIDTSFTEGLTAMETNFPEASLVLDFVADFMADLDIEICIVDCANIGPPKIDTGPASVNLLDISTADLAVEKELFGGLTTITAQFPDIDTATSSTNAEGNLVSTATSLEDLFNVAIDLDMIAASLLGLPPSAFGDSFSAGGASASYTLLSLILDAGVKVKQSFEFDPELLVSLLADDGQQIDGIVGDSLTFDNFGKPTTTITPTFSLANMFTSQTFLVFDVGLTFEALAASLSADFGGIIPSFSETLGPLVSAGAGLDIGSIMVYETKYAMTFGSITGEDFVVTVSEPGTLALFFLGMLCMMGAAARRRGQLNRA